MYAKFSIRDKKSEKGLRFSKEVYYLSQMQILHIKLYILILPCSLCTETFELFKMSMFVISQNIFFGGVLFGFFYKKKTFFIIANADFAYLAIHYNLIMQFMFCDTYVMLNTDVSYILCMKIFPYCVFLPIIGTLCGLVRGV